jgi:hypothetical protein
MIRCHFLATLAYMIEEGRGQKAEGRRQKAEGRRQKGKD